MEYMLIGVTTILLTGVRGRLLIGVEGEGVDMPIGVT